MNVNYPSRRAAALIREEAETTIREAYGDDGKAPPILTAILNAQNDAELAFLGAALLSRSQSLADSEYRFGEDRYPARLAEIAAELGWTP